MQAKLVTFDVYMALLDIEGGLVPAIEEALNLPHDTAVTFVRLWRAKQMERAASSNSLQKDRTSFRDCSALALDYCLARHGLTPSPDGAGFNKLTLSPVILPELGHVEAWHDCRNGKITAGWTLDGSAVTYTVTLPAGCEATFTPSEHHTNCRLGDTPISNAGITLQAGTHEITFDLNT